ncbi:MAG: neutral/alkaline non-lysosomal ceramidase N-terminal domain-containing protein, partial [Dehalococcoidia bacterium]
MHDGLTVGIERANITPSLTVPHAGWGAQTHLLADGVHEELFVTVIYIGQGDTRTVIVEFDLVGLYSLAADVRREVAEVIGIPSEAVRVVVTHNHANPVMWEHWVGDRGDQVELYKSTLPAKAAGAARLARANARPARLRAGHGSCHIGRNRRQRLSDGRIVVGRNDAGVTDPDVFVVRFDDLDGEPIAGLMGYTCHPTTLGPDNRLMSPDYPGVAKRVFQKATGVPSLFLQGATGNVGPRMGFTADVRVVERLGTILGLEAAKVFSEIDT